MLKTNNHTGNCKKWKSETKQLPIRKWKNVLLRYQENNIQRKLEEHDEEICNNGNLFVQA